jgi:UDP-N-acetylmuramyl pentapeptide phosphotransferase/UDP-N-acetylglucosamine-1-phosphate transferase
MGDIGSFIIGGIVGIIVSAVGFEKVVVVLKEASTEILPVILDLI